MKKLIRQFAEKMPRWPWLKKITWTSLVLVFIVFFSFRHVNREYWQTEIWSETIGSDGTGYYSYLPATFIYHDYSFRFIDSIQGKYHGLYGAGNCGFCNRFEGKTVNKFFIGEAAVLSPFFLLADLVTRMSDQPRDGYSFYYMASVSVGGIFYMLLGLLAIRRLLKRRGVSDFKIAVVLASIYFGTTLFHYTSWQPSMTHVYSFSMIAIFVSLIDSLSENFNRRRLILAGMIYGLIIIIRPINAMCILSIPFIAGNPQRLKNLFQSVFRHYGALLLTAFVFALMIFIQLYAYHVQAGKWYVYSYDKEGFDFLHPHFFQCLFSYDNGMYVYSPLLLIATAGVLTLYKDLYKLITFVLFFVVIVWVISSWWAWTYGGSFGMRPMVDYYVFFALLLGLLLDKMRPFALAGTILLLAPLVWYMQFQTWQYRVGMIIWDGMNKEKYWRVFLHDEPQFYYMNTEPLPPKVPENTTLLYDGTTTFESHDSIFIWENPSTAVYFSGKQSSLFEDPKSSPPYWRHKLSDFLPDSLYAGRDLWLNVKMKIWLENKNCDGHLVIIRDRDSTNLLFHNPPIIRLINKEKEWVDYEYSIYLNGVTPQDKFFIGLSKEDHWKIYVDDMQLRFYRQN